MLGLLEGLIVFLPGLFMLWVIVMVIKRWRRANRDQTPVTPAPRTPYLPPGYDPTGKVPSWIEYGFSSQQEMLAAERRDKELRDS